MLSILITSKYTLSAIYHSRIHPYFLPYQLATGVAIEY
jgi:hypothetical protein